MDVTPSATLFASLGLTKYPYCLVGLPVIWWLAGWLASCGLLDFLAFGSSLFVAGLYLHMRAGGSPRAPNYFSASAKLALCHVFLTFLSLKMILLRLCFVPC